MPLELSGRLVTVLPEQTGNGKNGTWRKQDFVIELAGPFPKKVCMTAWGDKADALLNASAGEELKVSFDVESREYNGRWYTDLKAWKIEAAGGGQPAPQANKQSTNANVNAAPYFNNQGEDDGLPF